MLEIIGNTPLVKITKFDTGLCELYLKLENLNPGGSIKDRIAWYIVDNFEKEGLLKPGGTLVEATAGNTGLGLAFIAARKGYKLVIVIPDKMSKAKINHLRSAGAEVIITRSDVGKGHPEYYQDYAQRISKEIDNAVYVNQFANPINVLAHEVSTAPEIWQQMNHDIDAFVCGVGTGGTLTGVGNFFNKIKKDLTKDFEIIVADPKGSIIAPLINTEKMIKPGKWLVEGIGNDFVPSICNLDYVSKAYTINDQESFKYARELLKQEGIYGGSTTGSLLAAALKYCKEQTSPKRVCSLVCDGGAKYQDKMYNDEWLQNQGILI